VILADMHGDCVTGLQFTRVGGAVSCSIAGF